jgi:hypothetical protein
MTLTAAAVAVLCAIGVALGLSNAMARSSDGTALPLIRAHHAPAGWRSVTLPDGAVMSYPPKMHLVGGDPGSASAAEFGRAGGYRLYLNATPREGTESLRSWPTNRISHLLADDAASARELASARGVRFLGGTGTCVVDTYVTRIGAHHFTELACLVQGRRASSVIVAAAPSADWTRSASLLDRAVGAYQVR